jgi:dipeptidyl aminopeptidase/acylaminoacyl peptidase
MFDRIRNRCALRLMSFAAATALAASGGCMHNKTVTLNSSPQGAHLVFTKIDAQGESPFTPDPPVSDTPAEVHVEFKDAATHYRVVAHHVLCIPSAPLDILDDPQTTYTLRLTQYKKYVTALGYAPVRNGDVWQLKPAQSPTVATLDDKEPSPVYIEQPEKVTANTNPAIDFPGFTVSPAADLMVYEQVQLNTAAPGTYVSNLYKLPIATGESPTLLTQGDKHQHFPAFGFSGDKIYVDSDDDLRTDAPMAFDVNSNEASVDILEHDSNTLEYEFTAGRDCLAFTSYGEYGNEPVIQVCALDGTGPTPRATGVNPQISPDGNRILYSGKPENGSKFRLWTVNTRGPKGLRTLGPIDDEDCFNPHWSPDGKLVAFCSAKRSLDGSEPAGDIDNERDPRFQDPDSQHSFIWVIDADGKHAIRLTRNESFDSQPVWDRNGKTIYFRSNRGGVWNIWKLNLTNAAFTRLAVPAPGQ